MNINIDYQARIPIYYQIVNKIESFVTKEIMKPGDQIPSIRDLAYTLGINPNTVKKAYDLLEQKGIIISKSTKGTFIANNVERAKKEKIDNLVKDIKNNIEELKNYGLTWKEILEEIK